MSSQTSPPDATTSDLVITMTRDFDADHERVYQAYTDPKIIPHWWGLRDHVTVVEDLDVRPGGGWRYIQRNPETGDEYAFFGHFQEVVTAELLVSTFAFDGMPDVMMVDSTRFMVTEGGTRVAATYRFDKREQLDAQVTDLEEGTNDLWDRLDEYLSTATRAE